MLPFIYTPYVVEQIFKDNEKKNFYNFITHIYAFRMFTGASVLTNGTPIFTLASFTSLMTKSFPERLQFIINQSLVPEQTEVEDASKTFWNLPTINEDTYLKEYNNLVFLQKSFKVKILKKKSRNIPENFYTETAAMTFKTGPALLF